MSIRGDHERRLAARERQLAVEELARAEVHDRNEQLHRSAAALHEGAADRHDASARFFDDHDDRDSRPQGPPSLYSLDDELVSWSDDAKTYWDPAGAHWAWRDGDWLYELGGKPIGWIGDNAVYQASSHKLLFRLRPSHRQLRGQPRDA